MTDSPERRRHRIALWALLLGATVVAAGAGLWQRAIRLREREMFHKIEANGYLTWQPRGGNYLPPPEKLAAYYERKSRVRALAEYHIAMAAKYRRAIWRPWVEFEPDPVEPPQPEPEPPEKLPFEFINLPQDDMAPVTPTN